MYRCFFKRFFDIVFAILLLVMLLPALIVLMILVRMKLGKPILFYQTRIGRGEKSFKLFKFRTMTAEMNNKGELLPDEQRITPFGEKLRSLSLDELPELLSILKGDMSFVGPRPLPIEYAPFFKDEERIIHTVRGGLIPPDCLSGKTIVSWEEQFEYEIKYAQNVSFLLDIKVLISTLLILIKRVKGDYGAEVRESLIEHRRDMIK